MQIKNNNLKVKSNSDCEPILHLYLKFGIQKTVDMLDGVFAFALLDNSNDTIFVARDPYGVRPLYYFYDGENFVVSSEINGLSKFHNNKLNLNKLKSYLTTSF